MRDDRESLSHGGFPASAASCRDAAIVAAVEDALSTFGVRFAEMPLTPDRIVAALRAAGAYGKP